MGAGAVEVRNLAFAFAEQEVLSIERFSLQEKQSCAIMGPSGCGKSTFVHLIAGLLTPSRGSIQVLGQDLSLLSESARDRYRGQHIGFIFQRFHLFPALTVWDNLVLAQRLSRRPSDTSHLKHLLSQLGLSQFERRKPEHLSHGQAQRVAVARALAHSPSIVIADEPTSALDDQNAQDTLTLLRSESERLGAALIVVTHDHRVRGHLDTEFELVAAQ